jgi:hypothetical protein
MQLALISNLDQKYVIEERLRPKLFTETCEISTIPVNRVVIRPAGLGNRSRSGTAARSSAVTQHPAARGRGKRPCL